MAKSCANGKAKTTCILNRAICPDLTSKLVAKMKLAHFSLSTDSSNYQYLEKMKPLMIKLFDENEHKVVTHFLDMCLSKSATAESIFPSVNEIWKSMKSHGANCIALGVDKTSVNVSKHKSLIVDVSKEEPYSKAHGMSVPYYQ